MPYEKLQDPEAFTNWPHTLGRDGARTPMPWKANGTHGGFSSAEEPWLPVDKAHEARAVARQQDDPESMLEHFRRLIALRQASPALKWGDLAFLGTRKDVLAFTRTFGNETAFCVFNLSEKAVQWRPKAAATARVAATVAAEAPDAGVPGELPPFSGYIGVVLGD